MDSDRTRLISLFPALAGLPHDQGNAQELGSVREIVSLKQLEVRGWVRMDRGHVEVLDPVGLLAVHTPPAA